MKKKVQEIRLYSDSGEVINASIYQKILNNHRLKSKG